MTSPAPQPAPLRPGQRAAKPKAAKALTPRQRECLGLLAKPGAYAVMVSNGAFVKCGDKAQRVYEQTLLSLTWREPALALWDYSPSGRSQDEKCVITPAGRAALRAGSRGGRGRRR